MKARTSTLNFLLVIGLLGMASAVGVFRKSRDAQIFSQPLFESVMPAQISRASTDSSSFEYGEARLANIREEILATELKQTPSDVAEKLRLSLSKRLSPSDGLLAQVRGLFALTTPDAKSAQDKVLLVLKEMTDKRVPDVVLRDAKTYLAVMSQVEPKQARLLQKRLSNALEREGKLTRAEHLLKPPFAMERVRLSAANLKAVVAADPENPRVSSALFVMRQALIAEVLRLQSLSKYPGALEVLLEAEQLGAQGPELELARNRLFSEQALEEGRRLKAFNEAVQQRRYDAAAAEVNALEEFLPPERVNPLRQAVVNAELYGGFERGQRFSDDLLVLQKSGPAMRVIPIGRFVMGSPNNERDRSRAEGPQRELSVERGFAISQNEITVGLFALFVEQSSYQTSSELRGESLIYDETTARMKDAKDINWRHGFNGELAVDSEPVVHISQRDAQAFAIWLSQTSQQRYRLPTEAEFEYVLRADTTTRFYWGNHSPREAIENLAGSLDESPLGRRWRVNFAEYGDSYFGPAPVGQFVANRFGVFDIAGNVSEWVEDCWHESYARAPESLQAWVNPGCQQVVVRGGNWGASPAEARAASRLVFPATGTSAKIGFRVVREL